MDEAGPDGDRWALLYDGNCPLCTASAGRLVRLARPGAIEALDLHAPGVLARFPAVSHDAAMRAIHLIVPDGRVDVGAGALARTLATRGGLRRLAVVYYLPPIRQVCDGVYWLIARNRYRLVWGGGGGGRRRGGSSSLPCAGGSCGVDASGPVQGSSSARGA